jgi:hypothetical protein
MTQTKEEIASLKASHGNMRKKLHGTISELETSKSCLDSLKTENHMLQREKVEMDHMVARLREENSRLKDSVIRKKALVVYHKKQVEASREALEELKKMKCSAKRSVDARENQHVNVCIT